MKSFALLLGFMILNPSARAQIDNPCDHLCSEPQTKIWAQFAAADYLDEVAPALYSGDCYQTGTHNEAQAGLAFFYRVNGTVYYDGVFGSPGRMADYKAMSYAEAEQNYSSQGDNHRIKVQAHQGVADFSTASHRWVYAFRQSADLTHLYLVGLQDQTSSVLCDLTLNPK